MSKEDELGSNPGYGRRIKRFLMVIAGLGIPIGSLAVYEKIKDVNWETVEDGAWTCFLWAVALLAIPPTIYCVHRWVKNRDETSLLQMSIDKVEEVWDERIFSGRNKKWQERFNNRGPRS